jgi:hypothetical protein
MQDTMEEKAAKDFTIINRYIQWVLGVLLFCCLSCSPDLSDDQIPLANFPDEVINVNSYPALLSDGGFIIVPDPNVGTRGVILYRKNQNTFLAFERNCSYRPNEACATVNIDVSTLFMIDPCCGSSFNFDGDPIGGAAWRPLRQYEVIVGTGTVTITDTVIN